MGEPQATAAYSKRGKRWRRIVKRIVLALAILICLVAIGWFVWDYLSGDELDREIEKIRAAGGPTTYEELAAMAKDAPEAEDAGPYYAAAMKLGQPVDWRKWDKPERDIRTALDAGAMPSAELLAEAKALVEENRQALAKLDQATALAGCNYEMPLEVGFPMVSLRTMGQARNLARAVRHRTWLLAAEGQGQQAVDSAVSGLRLLRVFGRRPTGICHLSRIALVDLLVGDVSAILARSSPPAAALGRLEEALLDAEHGLDLKRMWTAERVGELECIREVLNPRAGQGGRRLPPLESLWYRLEHLASRPSIKHRAAEILRVHARYIAAAEAGYPDVLDAVKGGPGSRGIPSLTGWSPPGPSFGSIAMLTGRSLAGLRTARLAAMIERYQRANGRRPETLAELEAAGCEIPSDPFTGGKLIYRPSASGYIVYSVGDDRKDDGGAPLNAVGGDCGLRVRTGPETTERP